MKIALFHTTLPEPGRKLGGVEVAVHRLANELARHPGDEVTLFSLTPKPETALYRHVQLFERYPWLRANRAARLFLLPFLLNTLRLDGFDVLHLHGDDWFFFRRGTASVRTLHGSALKEARSATSVKRRLAQYVIFPLEHLSTRLATVPLAVGPETAALYGITHLADNGVDPGLFRPGAKAEDPTVLFVGTWAGRKRGAFLFRTFTEYVAPRMPEARLLMVSDHCPEHEQVDFVRFPSDEALAALYRRAWVFAYPSVYEGFGIPYVEAMASGTAVLCSANDGAQYVLDGGTYGIITEDRAFGEQLLRLLRDESERRRLEEEGTRRAAQFSWAAVAARHRAVYQQARTHWRSRGASQPCPHAGAGMLR